MDQGPATKLLTPSAHAVFGAQKDNTTAHLISEQLMVIMGRPRFSYVGSPVRRPGILSLPVDKKRLGLCWKPH
jgi:hypothetical protein